VQEEQRLAFASVDEVYFGARSLDSGLSEFKSEHYRFLNTLQPDTGDVERLERLLRTEGFCIDS
jgi:hypothetical protein